jgi:hypothetical protein
MAIATAAILCTYIRIPSICFWPTLADPDGPVNIIPACAHEFTVRKRGRRKKKKKNKGQQ